ncbi:MAG: hypothetical protein GY851_02985 [bacterium]|nr:hypothetical protein [bacterium]
MTIAVLMMSMLHAQADDTVVERFPLIEELPDPFLFQDGRRVQTREDWAERRKEMLDLVLHHQYGRVPAAPGNVQVHEVLGTSKDEYNGVDCTTLRLSMGPDNRILTTVHTYIPNAAEGPFLVVVRFGIDSGPVPWLAKRGYAYACFEHRELDADTEGYDTPGPAQMLYPDHDWASLAVWAWGASRVLDYLETLPTVDTTKSVITGHSRTGKAALLAGVLDERFAVVVPNGSGCGGAAAFRGAKKGVETLRLIALPHRFKSWFQRDFGRFSNKEARLPFDQHFMRAMVAPRMVVSTDGLDDEWANPPGTQAAWMGAQPVFDFLAVPGNNRCHFREGGHDQLQPDYEVLLDVADHVFKDAPLTRSFDTMPVPDMKPTWDWRRP